MPHSIPFRRKILYALIVLVLFVGIPEILVRLFWSPKSPSARAVGTRQFVNWLSGQVEAQDASTVLFRRDPHLLWALRPSLQFESVIKHRLRDAEKQMMRITINEDGYRGPRMPPTKSQEKELRVLCLGDSNFFGYPLDDEHAFPCMLGKALTRVSQAKFPIQVYNGGVLGYSVLQGERLYADKFQDCEFDWLLLAFLNNDAWRQPHADRDLMSRQSPVIYLLSCVADNVRLAKWSRSMLIGDRAPEDFVPRVELDDFLQAHRRLIAAAREKGARVMLVDYDAFNTQVRYSQRLKSLAEEAEVAYFPVFDRIQAAFRVNPAMEQYSELAERVRRRWTPNFMRQKPYLRCFAELKPEHLNEVGVAWLADQIAP